MRFIMLFIVGAFSFTALGSSSFQYIIRNNPTLSTKRAKKISVVIDKYCKEYGIPSQIMQAIMMQESAYKVDAYNSRTGDYGIGQVSSWNVKRHGLDSKRLLSDLDYSVKWSVAIFSWFYDTYPADEAIMRYNCGTRKSCVKLKSVQYYLKRIQKFM